MLSCHASSASACSLAAEGTDQTKLEAPRKQIGHAGDLPPLTCIHVCQMIGSMTVAPGKPLVGELESFLQAAMPIDPMNGPINGVGKQCSAVYVSMGTLARLSEPEIRGMAANLAALPHKVLWKISNVELPGDQIPVSI